MLPVRFTPRTLSVLRALKRHNDREWFRAHRRRTRRTSAGRWSRSSSGWPRPAAIRADLVASPRVSLYRIYRDTRFSEDKSPFKTHVGALFPTATCPRHEGAGLYLEIGPGHVLIAGGIYMPQPPEVQLVREHLAANFGRFRSLVESPAFRRAVGRVAGATGSSASREGSHRTIRPRSSLKLEQFLVRASTRPALRRSPGFYRACWRCCRKMAPLVRFLNEPLVAQARVADRVEPAGAGARRGG